MNYILKNWITSLPKNQQLQIILALRSCDTLGNDDPSRLILKYFRETVLNISLPSDSLVTKLDEENEERDFRKIVTRMCSDSNKYPINFYKKLIQGCLVIGYKHPDLKIRKRWFDVYVKMVQSLNLIIETEQEFNNRLVD